MSSEPYRDVRDADDRAKADVELVEVFVIGVLVSLVKIGAMAKVVMGVSFFSYVAFALCFTAALSNLDRVQIWREIQAATS